MIEGMYNIINKYSVIFNRREKNKRRIREVKLIRKRLLLFHFY